MSSVNPQLHGLLQIFLLPPELISCMISTMRRYPCEPALLKMRDNKVCTGSGPTAVPPCWSILLSKIHQPLASRSSNSTTNPFGMPSNPSARWTDLGKNWFLRHGGRLQHPTPWMVFPTPENQPTLKCTPGSTSASPGRSRPTGSRIPPPDKKRLPPWKYFTPKNTYLYSV